MTHIPDALRREVAARGESRCEYCRLHEDDTYFTHEIDHIYAEKHGGPTSADNLCVACADCNRNKGSDLCSLDPQTGDVVALFHPRRDAWEEHFQLGDDGVIVPRTGEARATARVLGFNRPDLVADRARLLTLRRYK
jgi:hypothetical protein